MQGKSGLQPLLRIEKSGDTFTVSDFHNGTWRPTAGPVSALTKAKFQEVVGHRVDGEVTGIWTKDFAFVHVPAGWNDKNFPTSTGYLVVWMMGPLELHKTT
ncbi:hypothetical protein ACI2UK_13790 [Ralstonia nicotianae]|uniref:hypothetical protein n=1 Tax=Ralstonia pseudosolanacearum TaxID=1310165 RepID=UPI002003CE59|nr:hypothetical protein [Ralstonia pseudosolanacearum]MCK4118385.1 hypothetical protein [Ralstonia pseudosolanacearum]